jgi:HAD superfamily hydrolase (TIGR01458 family)
MQEPPPVLIALGMTRYWRATDGLRLDAGAYVSALQYASGMEPIVLGKPAQAFFDAAVQRLAVSPDDVLMIGDDIRSDIDAAQQAGLHGLLVRTGKFRPVDLEGPIQPDAVIDSIAELPGWWSVKHKK